MEQLKGCKCVGRKREQGKGVGWERSADFNNTSRGGSTEKLTLEQSLAGEEVSHGAEAMVSGRDNSLRRLAMCLNPEFKQQMPQLGLQLGLSRSCHL